MGMLEARPKGLFSWRFQLCEGQRLVATMDMAWLSEGGSFTWEGTGYALSRESLWSGDFVLTGHGETLARATKPSAFLRRFDVYVGPCTLTLEAVSPLSSAFHLLEDGSVVGAVTPRHVFSRCCIVDFPDELPMPVKVFMFWLVALMWHRAASS